MKFKIWTRTNHPDYEDAVWTLRCTTDTLKKAHYIKYLWFKKGFVVSIEEVKNGKLG
jgi:hypothetical protein